MAENARKLAARVVSRVVWQGMNLQQALADSSESRDKALIQALSYGVLRWYFRLDFLVNQLVRKPLRDKDRDIQVLAMVGLYQLGYSQIKPHAAVSETVAAVGKKQWAKGLLNGVLRNYQREKEQLESLADQDAPAAYAHPQWMIDLVRQDWGERAGEIFTANNRQAPMVIRVNQAQTSRQDYLQVLLAEDITARPVDGVDSALLLEQAVDVQKLPGFEVGRVSVQDSAAQLAAQLLRVEPGDRVLDLCAAPGGKTMHLLESQPELARLVAIDVDEQRLQRVQENLTRAGLHADVAVGDAAEPAAWWDGQLFHKILLDAPCSASGVIRRHPDIKLLRRPEDIAELIKVQQKILQSAWQLLAPGGTLLYATCSIFRQENQNQIKQFVQARDDVELVPIDLAFGHPSDFGHQILPGEGGMDGFFYACLGKRG